MKTKLLFLLGLLAFQVMDVSSKQLETDAVTLREIKLKSTTRIGPKSMNPNSSLNSKVKEIEPDTYQVGNSVAVNFASRTSNAAIVVTNAETGEVVHHELFSCRTPTTALIELEGCSTGLYYLNITTTTTEYDGEFTIE